MPDDTISFMDSDNYSYGKQEGVTFMSIVLIQVQRCVRNGSEEWCGGHWATQTHSVGGVSVTEKKYVQDKIKIYINSIRQLRALLLSYIEESEKYGEIDLELFKELQELEEKIKKEEDKDKKRLLLLDKVEIAISMFENIIKLLKSENFMEEIAEYETWQK